MLRRRLIVAIGFVCIVNCSSTKMMPGYRHIDAAKSTLGVVLVKKNIAISNPEDISQFIGGANPEQAFYDLFGAEFPSLMQKYSKFRQVIFPRGAEERMDRGVTDISPDAVTALPPGRHFFSDSLGYLLIIDQLGITRIRKSSSQMATEGTFVTGFGGIADEIVFSAMFVLWDNMHGAVAAYGAIREKSIPFIEMSRSVWMELLEKMAVEAVAGTPYRK